MCKKSGDGSGDSMKPIKQEEWWRHTKQDTTVPTSLTALAKHRAMHEQLLHFDQDTWLLKHAKQPRFQYSSHQKHMLRQWFNALDSDGSGFISVEELEDPMLSIGIVNDTHEIEEIVRKVDKDANGQIDFQEFVAFLTPQSRHKKDSSPQKHEVMFRQLTKKMELQSSGLLDINTQLSMERRRFILDSITSFTSQSIQKDLAELKHFKGEPPARRSKHRRGLAKKAKLAALALRQQEESRFQALEQVFLRNRALKRLQALPPSMLGTPVASRRAQRQLPPLKETERSSIGTSPSLDSLEAQRVRVELLRPINTDNEAAVDHSSSVPDLPTSTYARDNFS